MTNRDREYIGPLPGSTPADDSDLHTSLNPFNDAGSPPVDLSRTSEYNSGQPFGYFTNPPTPSTGNPYSHGAPSKNEAGDLSAADYIAGALAAEYQHALGYLTGGTDTPPIASDVYFDEGYGPSGTGRS